MKRQDGALNPARRRALPAPGRVCGAPLRGGGTCQRLSADGPCADHGGKKDPDLPAGLPDGFKVHKVFKKEDRQAELERYVERILVEYGLNQSADLRQVLLSGIAYVRLLFDGPTLEPKDLDYLSRVVDRHLRNLRATPKEQQEARSTGDRESNLPGPSGLQAAAILERVRVSLSASQLQALAGGTGAQAQAQAQAPEAGEVEVEDPEFPAPRRAEPDDLDDLFD